MIHIIQQLSSLPIFTVALFSLSLDRFIAYFGMSSSKPSAKSPFGTANLQTQVQPSSVQFLGLLSQDSDLRISVQGQKR